MRTISLWLRGVSLWFLLACVIWLAITLVHAATLSAVVQTTQVTVGTTATLIWTAPAGQTEITIRNAAAGASVFIGGSAGVSITTGFEIPTGAAHTFRIANRSPVYGIVAAATQVVSVIQGDFIPGQ